MKFIPSEIFFEERFKDGGYGLLAAYRRARGSSRFAWYKGRRPPGAVSVFIAWTEWTLAMALLWWQHYIVVIIIIIIIVHPSVEKESHPLPDSTLQTLRNTSVLTVF